MDFGAFSVATLKTGSYRLVIDVTDVASGETAVTERTFWVYRPGMQAETQARRIALAEPGFDIAAMSDAEVASELEKVEILLQSKIARSVRQLGPQDKRAFLAGFWSSNDPDTTTRTNEWRDEFLRRIDEANARYGSLNKVGWKSDQGRVYVRFGEPDRIEDHPFDYGVGKAYQVWEYDNIEGGVIFVFVDRNNYGDYVQVHSTLNGEINNPNWIQQELRARP
ncbi:MAG TPA: GWxTD domain-containing protein [Bacteroidetes bacterium]|nr:GWxTD domain-containing protein [Bacteroidota bacterium]